MKTTALTLALCAALWGQTAHQHHPPQSASEYAHILEDPQRDAWQLPHDVIMALDPRPDEVVADIGAGTGYFTRRLAHHAAKVYAVDIDSKLLDILRKDAPPSVTAVLAAPDDPRLPDHAIDTIFFCDVLHHIQNRPAYYRKLARALKPDGRIVDIDFHKKPTPMGPPEAMRLSEEQVVSELQAAGFRKVKQFDILPYQYFLVFKTAANGRK